jgi:hypothetical protein
MQVATNNIAQLTNITFVVMLIQYNTEPYKVLLTIFMYDGFQLTTKTATMAIGIRQ